MQSLTPCSQARTFYLGLHVHTPIWEVIPYHTKYRYRYKYKYILSHRPYMNAAYPILCLSAKVPRLRPGLGNADYQFWYKKKKKAHRFRPHAWCFPSSALTGMPDGHRSSRLQTPPIKWNNKIIIGRGQHRLKTKAVTATPLRKICNTNPPPAKSIMPQNAVLKVTSFWSPKHHHLY